MGGEGQDLGSSPVIRLVVGPLKMGSREEEWLLGKLLSSVWEKRRM